MPRSRAEELAMDHSCARASFELTEEEATEARMASMRLSGPSASSSSSSASSYANSRARAEAAQGGPATGGRDGFAGRRTVSAPALPEEETQAFAAWRLKHPCILSAFTSFVAGLRGKRLAVFLDYDGTLTPIVSNPEDAILSEEMRSVVRQLAHQFPTAIISGRGREKVENFVQLSELYYAGSHGMDIAGPPDLLNTPQSRQDSSFQPAAHFRPIIDEVYHELCTRLADIPGAYVEHNIFCVSAHYRNCPGEVWQQVVAAVEETLASKSDELKITRGRKVVEIRPKVNWHKGTALDHLLEVLGLKAQPDVVAIYIGDDRTDEDAFKVLQEGQIGYGILVSSKVKDTAASYTVRNPLEVQELLQGLVDWAATPDNGWHKFSGSVGSWRAGGRGGKGLGGPRDGLLNGEEREHVPGDEQAKWQKWQQQVALQQETAGGGGTVVGVAQ